MRRLSGLFGFAVQGISVLAILAAGAPAAFGDDTPGIGQVSKASVRGETPEARAHFLKGQSLEKVGRDAEAAAIYKDVVKEFPEMLAALNGLAYLQATSNDPGVRDPVEAVFNAERLCALSRNHYVTRRENRESENVLHPYNNLVLPASFYKVVKINTMAAAYAAAGNFTAPSSPTAATMAAAVAAKGAYPEAILSAKMAVEAARAILAKEPTERNEYVVEVLVANLRAYESGQALFGVRQPMYLEMQDWREETAPVTSDDPQGNH